MNFEHSNSSFSLWVSGLDDLTSRIRRIQLRPAQGAQLPLISPGARLQLAGDNSSAIPICSNPLQRDYIELAVLKTAIDFPSLALGQSLTCTLASPGFHLHADAAPALFIAAGIGAAALKPLAETLALRGRRLAFHYAGRSRVDMAFVDVLQRSLGVNLRLYLSDQQQRLDVANILSSAPNSTQLYLCAPQGLMNEGLIAATDLGFAQDQIQTLAFESQEKPVNKAVVLELARSGKLVQVAPEQPLLHALRMAGVSVPSKCCIGECGTCTQQVLAGRVDHRDEVLTPAQRAQGKICVCVSRAQSDLLVLDL